MVLKAFFTKMNSVLRRMVLKAFCTKIKVLMALSTKIKGSRGFLYQDEFCTKVNGSKGFLYQDKGFNGSQYQD